MGIVTVTGVGGRTVGRRRRHEAAAQSALPPSLPRGGDQHAVWLYHVFSLSLRDVELLPAERGITLSYETELLPWAWKTGFEPCPTRGGITTPHIVMLSMNAEVSARL